MRKHNCPEKVNYLKKNRINSKKDIFKRHTFAYSPHFRQVAISDFFSPTPEAGEKICKIQVIFKRAGA